MKESNSVENNNKYTEIKFSYLSFFNVYILYIIFCLLCQTQNIIISVLVKPYTSRLLARTNDKNHASYT